MGERLAGVYCICIRTVNRDSKVLTYKLTGQHHQVHHTSTHPGRAREGGREREEGRGARLGWAGGPSPVQCARQSSAPTAFNQPDGFPPSTEKPPLGTYGHPDRPDRANHPSTPVPASCSVLFCSALLYLLLTLPMYIQRCAAALLSLWLPVCPVCPGPDRPLTTGICPLGPERVSHCLVRSVLLRRLEPSSPAFPLAL